MRTIIIAGFVIALASGLFLNYAGHPWQVLAQTSGTQNATQGSTGKSNATQSSGSSGGGNATSQSQGASQGGGSGKSTTPPSTVQAVKGGPKAAGSASQLQQIEGNNTSVISQGSSVGNKPGLQALSSESNTTSQSNATGQSQGASQGGGGGGGGNATSGAAGGAGSAANKTSAGASSAGQNASSAAQGQNNTNPLAKIPVIGKLFGG